MTSFHPDTAGDLDAAASLLVSVGHADPDRCEPAVRIHCLGAADQLQAAGARPSRIDVAPDVIPATIRAAMAHLGRLPRSMFATVAVVAAADAAQTALERVEDRRAEP